MWVGLRAGVEDIGVVCVNPLLPVDPASSVGKLNTIHTCAVWLLCRKIGKHYFSHSGAPSTPPSLFLLMGVTFTLTPWNLIIAEFKNRTSSTMFVRQATFSKDRECGRWKWPRVSSAILSRSLFSGNDSSELVLQSRCEDCGGYFRLQVSVPSDPIMSVIVSSRE